MAQPLWVTPERQRKLVDLFERSGGFCVYGHANCLDGRHHYPVVVEECIDYWKADDREGRNYEWKQEERRIHHGEKGRFGQRFDPIDRETFVARRPEYYLVALGVSPFTFKQVAVVRVPSTHMHLFVEVGDVKLSKNKRRQLARYGVMPGEIHQRCLAAVRDWWATPTRRG